MAVHGLRSAPFVLSGISARHRQLCFSSLIRDARAGCGEFPAPLSFFGPLVLLSGLDRTTNSRTSGAFARGSTSGARGEDSLCAFQFFPPPQSGGCYESFILYDFFWPSLERFLTDVFSFLFSPLSYLPRQAAQPQRVLVHFSPPSKGSAGAEIEDFFFSLSLAFD